jgi:acyl-coenzyme A thioesterase 13
MSSSDEAIRSHVESHWEGIRERSPIYRFLFSDIVIFAATKGSVVARLKLADQHINSKGGLHGSVSAAIFDWIGGMAISSWDLRSSTGVSTDLHVTFVSSAKAGDEIEIEAKAEKVGGTLAFTRATIFKLVDGQRGPVVATGSHTKYVRI